MKNIKLDTHRKTGFSLLEMFVVIAIIGLIAAIAIPIMQEHSSIEKHPDAVAHPNNNVDYPTLAKQVAHAWNLGLSKAVFKAEENVTLDSKLKSILKFSVQCEAPTALTTAIASQWITETNMKKHLSATPDGKLQVIDNKTTAETNGQLPEVKA